MQSPFIRLYAYGIFNPAIYNSHVRCHHCCGYFTDGTISLLCQASFSTSVVELCQASFSTSVAELTTRPLRLINILLVPLCRINKFGFYFS